MPSSYDKPLGSVREVKWLDVEDGQAKVGQRLELIEHCLL